MPSRWLPRWWFAFVIMNQSSFFCHEVMKSIFVTKLWFEFGQYMVVGVESLGSMANIMKEHVLFYTHMFMGRMGKFAHFNFLGNKNMPSLVDNIVCFFLKDYFVYQNGIYPKVLSNILEPILKSGMVCLSIFNGGVITYTWVW